MEGLVHEKTFHRQCRASRNFKVKTKRYYKSVGCGYATPRKAKEGNYVDRKCPWTGDAVAIRGKILRGIVVSSKMTRTVVVRRSYLHYVAKYRRYEKRHNNTSVHVSPALDVKDGDILTFGECRPLSKTIRFNAIAVTKNKVFGNPKKAFKLF